MTTMGEFFDLLLQTKNASGKLFLERTWRSIPSGTLSEFRECPFCKDGITVFLEFLKYTMGQSIMMHDDQELYACELAEAHTFLQEVHRLASANGILIGLREVDGPITYAETMVASGVVRMVDGAVTLTPKGLQLARKVEEGIKQR